MFPKSFLMAAWRILFLNCTALVFLFRFKNPFLFQNSEILASEKNYIICILFNFKKVKVPRFNMFTAVSTCYTNWGLFDQILGWWRHNMWLEF